jgi:hypothetical protein
MAKKTDALAQGRNPLTPKMAATLAEGFADGQDGDDVARMLLLLWSFTYERDINEREYMMRAVEARLGILMTGFDELQAAQMRRQLESLKEGGAR